MDDLNPQNSTPPIQQPPPQRADLISFLKKNKFILAGIAFVLFFFYILFTTVTTPKPSSQTKPQPTPSLTQVVIPMTPTSVPKKALQTVVQQITWSPVRFSELDTRGVQLIPIQFSDGTTKYTYPSSNPNRPNEIIVKDGNVISHRTLVFQKYTYHYTNTLEAPDYTFIGSRFYGPNTATYIYLKRGTAFVTDATTTLVHEQRLFEPMNLEDFKQKYGDDITDYTVIPTLPDP